MELSLVHLVLGVGVKTNIHLQPYYCIIICCPTSWPDEVLAEMWFLTNRGLV